MRRLAVLLTVLFAMLWQSVALARPGSTVNVMADLTHAALHLQEESHHHHDDGSYHLDDSNESVHHMMGDPLSGSPALVASTGLDFAPAESASPRGPSQGPVPLPFLDGLLRPPRLPS